MDKAIKTAFAIVLNYNTYNDTVDCITNLLKSDYHALQIIVIDNHSPDNSLQKIEAWVQKKYGGGNYKLFNAGENISFNSKITLVQAGSNNGFGYGNNIALKQLAGADAYIFLVNPDINVTPTTVSSLVRCISLNEDNLIAGCSIYDYKTKNLLYYGIRLNHITGTIKLISDKNDKQYDYICGGASFFSARILTRTGLLPEDYFLYWEDADWGYNAKKAGFKLVVCYDAIVYDKGATSIGRGYLAEYYYTRNSLLFHKKIGKPFLTIIIFNFSLKLAKKILLGQHKRAKAVIAGTVDFILKKYKNAPQKKVTD